MDLYSSCPELPVPVDFQLSAVTGQGIAEWLDEVRNGSRVVWARLLDVDYERYADAEAALGWVNVQVDLALRRPLSPTMLAGPLLDEIEANLSRAGMDIAHLKLFDRCGTGFLKVSICHNGDEPRLDGDLSASPDRQHELVINLRAVGDPDELRAIVQRALEALDGELIVRHSGAFRPSPPKPEHRYATTVL